MTDEDDTVHPSSKIDVLLERLCSLRPERTYHIDNSGTVMTVAVFDSPERRRFLFAYERMLSHPAHGRTPQSISDLLEIEIVDGLPKDVN